MSLRLITALFCDDLRKEDNGKQIVIGTYINSIGFETLPAQTSLVAAVIAEATETALFELKFSVRLNEKEIMSLGGDIDIHNPGQILMPLRLPILSVNADDEISLHGKANQSSFKRLASLVVGKSKAMAV